MGFHIFQERVGPGRIEGIGGTVHIAGFRVPVAAFEDLCAVEVFIAHILTGRSDRLIELVDDGLRLRCVLAVLQDRRNGAGDHIAIRIRVLDILQRLFVIADKRVYRNRTVHIVAADHDIDAARLHLCDRLRDRVGIGVIGKSHTTFPQEIRNLQIVRTGILIQRDPAVFLQGHHAAVPHEQALGYVGIVGRTVPQDRAQARVERVLVRIIGVR